MGQNVASLLSNGFMLGSDAFEFSDGVALSGRLSSVEGVELRTFQEPAREPVHVWIDFSRPEATMALLEQTDRPVVICTTGFTVEQKEIIQDFARKVPVLMCPNTSPGLQVMSEMLRKSAGLSSLGFTAVLEEDHHRHKKDSPSGTAKRLLEVLRESGFGDVQVHVTRAGDIVGNHTVRLIADGEEVLVQHRVTDRMVFARGALWGASFLLKQTEPRIYSFEEV